jgi:hypothetical protein
LFNKPREPKFPDNYVTVENINTVDIEELGVWVADWLLGVRIPRPSANVATSTIMPEINSMLADIPNRASLCTELYACVVGHVASLKVQKSHKKLLDEDVYKAIETDLMVATAKQDILYRTWQQLEVSFKGCSRMVGVADNEIRGAGGR